MCNKLLAVYAKHEKHGDEVCFIVIAESLERMGWPLMATFGKLLWENYAPLRVATLGPAPEREVAVLDVVGAARSIPSG
jgi:hypothetical protein